MKRPVIVAMHSFAAPAIFVAGAVSIILPRWRASCAILGSLIAASAAHAQNLVPNPSFEFNTACPMGQAQIHLAVPWVSPTQGTPDYFHTCSTNPFSSVPTNVVGTEMPRTGEAYAGFIAYRVGITVREYMETALSTPLVANQAYEVAFYVSLGDDWGYAIDRLGAYFSTGSVGFFNHFNELPFVPQVTSPPGVFYNNYNGWALVSGVYVAAGGEDHLVIGNFNSQANMNTQLLNPDTVAGTYYYVDDVSVTLGGGCQPPCPAGQACFSGCGTLIQGNETGCVLFQADAGGLYVLSNLGGFNVGDYVTVTGCLDPNCITTCQQGNGCILNNTIEPCLCVEITDKRLSCVVDPTGQTGFRKDFNVTNNTGVPIHHMLVLPSAPVTVNPNVITFNPPIPPGGSESVNLVFSNVEGGTEFCFTMTFLDAEVQECCTIEQCVKPCMQITTDSLTCSPGFLDTYIYTFTVTNLFNQPGEHLFLIPPAGSGITFNPNYFDLPTLNQCQSVTLQTTITVPAGTSSFCYLASLHNVDLHECCGHEECLDLPDCATFNPCDFNHDGIVGIDDLFMVIAAWGACSLPCPPQCAEDIDDNCLVNIDDLFAVIAAWGPSP